jgi:hypothetical protein
MPGYVCVTSSGEGEFFFDEGEVMAGLDPTTRAALMAQRLEVGARLGKDYVCILLQGRHGCRAEDVHCSSTAQAAAPYHHLSTARVTNAWLRPRAYRAQTL